MKYYLLMLVCAVLMIPSVGCWDEPPTGSSVEKPDADPKAFNSQPGPTQVAPPG